MKINKGDTMRMRPSISKLFCAGLASAALLGPTQAADFYANKKIDFLIGADAGGGYDVYARLIAKYLPQALAGTPTVVPRNMPGAGSATAAASIYRIVPKDGTSIGALFPGVVIAPLLEDNAQKDLFDPSKFVYLGSADNLIRVCVTYETSKIKTMDDALKNKTIVGASAAGGSTRDYAVFTKKATHAQFDIINGYKGTVDILLAMERGEVDAMCGIDWSSLKAQRGDWVRDHKLNVIVRYGADPQKELDELKVPDISKFIPDDNDKKAVDLIVSQQTFGRPYIAPPETPEAQVKLLRDAFMKVMENHDFIADAEHAHMDVTPTAGDKVQDVVNKIYSAPPAIAQRARELIKP
jgi:tripartite-type tricarboxylate transporter receptor subunit TctC